MRRQHATRRPQQDDVEQIAHELERGTSSGTPFAVIGGVGVVIGALFLLGLLAAVIAYWLA